MTVEPAARQDQDQDAAFMALALVQRRHALPACLPDPPVGCVLVSDKQVIIHGFTQPLGQHHAKVMALSRLQTGSRGMTAYVTAAMDSV